MKEPAWIPIQVVLAAHEMLIAEFGGQPGVRDRGLLESALARPQNQFLHQQTDLEELAVLYVSGIIRNHPFFDGNKRTGFMMGYDFLFQNGRVLAAPEAETARAVLDLADRTITETEFAAWLRQHCKPR